MGRLNQPFDLEEKDGYGLPVDEGQGGEQPAQANQATANAAARMRIKDPRENRQTTRAVRAISTIAVSDNARTESGEQTCKRQRMRRVLLMTSSTIGTAANDLDLSCPAMLEAMDSATCDQVMAGLEKLYDHHLLFKRDPDAEQRILGAMAYAAQNEQFNLDVRSRRAAQRFKQTRDTWTRRQQSNGRQPQQPRNNVHPDGLYIQEARGRTTRRECLWNAVAEAATYEGIELEPDEARTLAIHTMRDRQ